MSGGVVKDIRSKAELDETLRGAAPVVLHFWASWCAASKQMDQVFTHLAKDFPQVSFVRVEAEELPEISEAFAVSTVPYFIFCKDGGQVDILQGADPSSLVNKVANFAGPGKISESSSAVNIEVASAPTETATRPSEENGSSPNGSQSADFSDALRMRLQQLVDSYQVFLFMKGSPGQPKCGFSQKVVEILKDEGVEFGSFDILLDDEVREGVKKFSNWPSFPQLFCRGELVGGCDIAAAMHESGELKDLFKEQGVPVVSDESNVVKLVSSSDVNVPQRSEGLSASTEPSDELSSRIRTLINSSPVMVFMKGKPDAPKCGFSRKVIDILQQEKVAFNSFDILSDDEVRQGLKILSNWPSYPQLYVGGELIGGSDTVMEMQKSGELKRVLTEKGLTPKMTLEDRMKDLITSSPVMLFMKGTPDAPRCGFSSKVVDALRKEGITFGSFDILSNEEVRQGLKTYSNWPTYPQLYYKGELIGGCDIVLELQNVGDLKSTLSE